MLLTGLGTYVGTWLVLSVTLLISCAMKSPGVSIAVGIVFYFATSILSGILTIIVDKWEWLKWNPISMMNIMIQIVDKSMKKYTKLELHELFIGNIVYIVIFLILVVFVLKRKMFNLTQHTLQFCISLLNSVIIHLTRASCIICNPSLLP